MPKTIIAPTNNDDFLKQHILAAKIRLLSQRIPAVIVGQLLIIIYMAIALWEVIERHSLTAWLIFMAADLILLAAIFYYYRYKKFFSTTWRLTGLTLLIFLAGLGWGYLGSILIPANSFTHQTLIFAALIILTAGTIPFLASFFSIYILFLITAMLPLINWQLTHGEVHTLLGYGSILYMGVAIGCCYYINKLLTSTLLFQHKNSDLDRLNQLLEQHAADRTRDLAKSLAITQSTLEATIDAILVVNRQGNMEYFNQRFSNLWQNAFTKQVTFHDFIKHIEHLLQKPKPFLSKITNLHDNPTKVMNDEIHFNDGKIVEWYSQPYKIGNDIAGRVWCFRDVTPKKLLEQQLFYQANHDTLTGLANRSLLYQKLEKALHKAAQLNSKLFILFIDIDNFKLINDSLGHEIGDHLLQEIANRLKSCTLTKDLAARFGGDEFVILLMVNQPKTAIDFVETVLAKITQPLNVLDNQLEITASIGISNFPEHGNDAMSLLKNADMAMYQAKNQGKNIYQFYDETNNKDAKKNLTVQTALRQALINNEFFLLYQPTVDIKTGKIIGAEALIRWQHPTEGMISPQNFISIAEESGLIVPIGEWIFRQACLQNKAWQDQGLKPIRIAINVSGKQLQRDTFTTMVSNCINETKLAAQFVEIELTESIIMDDREQNFLFINRLHEMGIQLTIDDFGTGYSSLNYLREFPVKKLKIAQSFIANCYANSNDGALVKAIIAIGHSLNLKVLAEGIETKEQLIFLHQHQCDQGQGFYFAKPLTADQFANYLEQDNPGKIS